MNFLDFSLDKQLEIQDKYRNCNFAEFKYEFTPDGVKLPDPVIYDRYGSKVNLGDLCIMALSCGKSSATLSEYVFIGTLTLKQDGQTRVNAMAIMKDPDHDDSCWGDGMKRFMFREEKNYDVLNIQGKF
jgi:hypothetical protein